MIKHTQTVQNTKRNTHTAYSRLINLTNVTFTKEQINTVTSGLNCALEKDPKYYISELIIDIENAIRHLDPKIKNTFQYLKKGAF